jgi:hypothetical protein
MHLNLNQLFLIDLKRGKMDKNIITHKLEFFPKPKNVVFNNTTTIVFWSDGTKTISKLMDGDTFDPEHGVAMCVAKKIFGSHSKLRKFVKKNGYTQENEINKLAKKFKKNTISV